MSQSAATVTPSRWVAVATDSRRYMGLFFVAAATCRHRHSLRWVAVATDSRLYTGLFFVAAATCRHRHPLRWVAGATDSRRYTGCSP